MYNNTYIIHNKKIKRQLIAILNVKEKNVKDNKTIAMGNEKVAWSINDIVSPTLCYCSASLLSLIPKYFLISLFGSERAYQEIVFFLIETVAMDCN